MNKTFNHYNHLFYISVLLLVLIGTVFVYSASSVFALEMYGSSYYFLYKQILGLFVGIGVLLATQLIPSSSIKQLSPYLFIGSIALTALTLSPQFAHRIHGSSRWLKLPGLSFQPSELLKITIVLCIAYYIANQPRKTSFWYGYVPILAILIIPSLILLKQPDFGLTVTLFVSTLCILFIAQFEIRHVLLTLASLIPAGILLIVMQPYRLQRITTFLNPWNDPRGSGFQIIQSLIAIGSGGVWGIGIAQSRQKFFYLPMQHTDFIFAIIAEETGFIGASLLVFIFILFLYSGIKIATLISDQFTRFVVVGYVIIVNIQALINIGVATNLLPTKGIGLPFISYGNSSLVCNLWMVGIIINLLRSHKKTFL